MSIERYLKEFTIISSTIKNAYEKIFTEDAPIKDKGKFDVVTSNDYKIEEYIIGAIQKEFPMDKVLGEETSSSTDVTGRTWTIDPIDGTYNMSRNSPLFGIQCALYINEDIVFSIIYLPKFDELFYAEKGGGAYLNGRKISVAQNNLEHAVISFGDFPHTRPDDFNDEHNLMKKLSSKVAKIRMLGSACFDFAYLASGRTDGTIIFTRNKWDIAPGILIASEAGAIVRSLSGDYSFDSRAVVATSTMKLYNCILECNVRDD